MSGAVFSTMQDDKDTESLPVIRTPGKQGQYH